MFGVGVCKNPTGRPWQCEAVVNWMGLFPAESQALLSFIKLSFFPHGRAAGRTDLQQCGHSAPCLNTSPCDLAVCLTRSLSSLSTGSLSSPPLVKRLKAIDSPIFGLKLYIWNCGFLFEISLTKHEVD